MNFPNHDSNWTEIIELLQDNNWSSVNTIAPVEFCNELGSCFPYEWSYWNSLLTYECLIIHKGMYDRLKNDFLDNLEENYDYVLGNAVFNVYVLSSLNNKNLKGHEVHFSLNTIIQALKKLLKIGKQYKAKSDKKNILLVTANHSGNIGDDAITLASQDILQSVYPDANIVIDKGPASKELISKVDLVVLGGGGVFYDNCFYNAINYCQYFLYANEYNVKSCAVGIGAQGINSKYGIELYKKTLDLASFVVVRDKHSYTSLTSIVNLVTPVIVKQDVVYTLKSEGNIALSKNSNKPLLLFSLLDASRMPTAKHTMKYQESQFECMDYLVKYFDVKLLVQSSDDNELYEKFRKKHNLDIIYVHYNDVKKIINIYKQASLVITSRLHGFILAAQAQVAIIPVASKNAGSKLYTMIFDSVPSSRNGYIVLKDYCLEILKQKINIFNQEEKLLVPNLNEVSVCQQLAHETADVIRQYIPEV